jgi:thioredoxin 1
MANNVTDADFQKEVLEAQGLVIVDFWAEWCTPCKMLGPIIEELAEEYLGKVKVFKLNVDENSETASKYQVLSIPVVKFFKDGKLVDNIIGMQPKENFKAMIEKNL